VIYYVHESLPRKTLAVVRKSASVRVQVQLTDLIFVENLDTSCIRSCV